MATKKISELPLVNRVSGSQVAGGSVLPIVIGGGLQGTTDQISVENFSIFVNAYNAHTGSAGNTFTGPQTINNNVTINGKLTVTELVATYETASIIYSEGGNIFGNELTDKQQLTGSSNFTGSVFINGQDYTIYSSSNSTVFTNFSSSNSTYNTTFSSSNATYATAFSSSNSTYNTTFSSSNATYVTALSSSNSSYNTTFSSSNSSYNTTFSSSNSSYNTVFSSSNATYVTALSSSNSSYNTIFSSSNAAYVTELSSSNSSYNTIFSSSNSTTITTFLAGTNSELARVYQTTASIQFQTASLLTFTASQDSRNFTLSQVTGSFRGEIGGLEAYSASLKAAAIVSSSTQIQNYDLFALNSNLYISTGSLIGITNGLMAFTAALDNTYATDAQLYQLYQATQSLELHSGSMIGVTNGLMAYTASNSTLNTGLRGEVDGIEAYTASLKAQAIVSSSTQVQNYDVFALNSNLYTSTGSLIGITNGLMAFTAALDSTYATDAQLYQLYQATRSIELHSGSMIGVTNGLMAYTSSNETWKTGIRGEISGIEAWTASLDSTYATDAQLLPILQATQSLELLSGSLIGITNGLMAFTAALDSTYATDAQLYQLYQATQSLELHSGSIVGIANGLMALTASMKAAAIVSSSQQITNYYKFAETASANTFYGNQTFASSGGSGLRVYGAAGTHQWDVYLNGENLRISDNTAGDAALVVDTRASFTRPVTASALNLTKSPDGIFAELGGNTPKLNLYKFSSGNVMNIGHNYYYDGVAYGKNDISLQGWEFRSHITNGQYTISHSPGGVTTLNQLIKVDATTGDLTITNGNLVVANGKGIDFSATANSGSTVTSEILNDYEAGTWTPTVEAVTGTYTTVINQRGTYTKIGRLVTVHFYFIVSTKGTGAGGFNITNLPYPVLPMSAGDAYIGSGINTSNSMTTNIQAIQATTICSGYRYDGTDSIIATNGNNGTVTYITYP